MSKIRPLNRDSLSDEDAPGIRKELQEDIALEMYYKALRLETSKEYEEAREILHKLINENIPQLEQQGGLPKSMGTLKYSCYFNLGNIYLSEQQTINALENFLLAAEVDDTDVTLWYKIGKLALEENRFKQSIYAFSKGLDCNEAHWPCLDEIISVLFAVQDTVGCLYYIGKALILDPDYMKGLVFRKKIYQDNPATKEYYQKSNPDYIWEPPLDIEINEKDEKIYLDEVQKLIDRIREEEKALETKPLSTIPLPKALENYSWMAVSKTVISLYEYVKNNEMSFLTFIDINKCMSQTNDEKIQTENEVPEVMNISEDIQEVVVNTTVEPVELVGQENSAILARRPSQTSDENVTPSQTDNDEEVQTEQDTEEPEERNEKAKKGLKRKRDLLLDLRVWGWHSKRKHVRKSKPEKFYTVEECLNQILPSNLLQNKIGDVFLQEESMNTMDMYKMFLEDRQMNILSPIQSPKSSNSEAYFGTNKEKEDVIKSWTRPRECCDTCELLKEFVCELSKLWDLKWPIELIEQYIIAYEMYREFHVLPNLFDTNYRFDDIRNETLSTLLYAELVLLGSLKDSEKERMLHIGQIQFLETMCTFWAQHWGDEYVMVFCRVFWLKTYIYRKEGSNEAAVRCLQLIEDEIEEEEKKINEKYCLFLPNCAKCGVISGEGVKRILNHLDMVKSISNLEELFEQEKYETVAAVIKSTFCSNSTYPTFGRVGRPAQLGMLLHSLWFTDLEQCFIWSEECLFEARNQYVRPAPDRPKWEKIVEKCLLMMDEIVKQKSKNIIDSLSEDKKARLTETLAKIVCKQIHTENSVMVPMNTISPWILLHHLLAKNEEKMNEPQKLHDDKSDDEEESVPASLLILFSAHEFLGPKGWCLTNSGELLHFLLDVLLDKTDVFRYEKLREKIDIQIEQAIFCLYQHPSKKNKISRHLADHNVDPLPLTWDKSFQLYEFYAPEVLPEFNSFKNASITNDLEQLLLRITALVVPECNPSNSMSKMNDYLRGRSETIPDPIEFPNKIRAIYYLLGDYYFKLREFGKCVKYFLMDLAINPERVDSWACLGLSFFSKLDSKLNFCKRISNEEEFLEKARCAQVGFKRALKLSPNDITLWIEYGTFEYMAHSFCSRYLKFESENLSMERFEFLENQKDAFLDSSGRSFKKAIELYEINENEADERWLQYYILGKIAEKKQKEPSEYLNYYMMAIRLLHENNCTYPDKISYNSPQYLSVEALDLHYRVNASILKYLELHEGKEIHNSIGVLFKKSLDELPLKRKMAEQRAQKKLGKTQENKTISQPTETDIKTNVTSTPVGSNDNPVDPEITEEIRKLLDDLLSKVVEMEEKEDPPTKEKSSVEAVDETVLGDSEYDVIMILSSDETDEESPTPASDVSNKEEGAKTVEVPQDDIVSKDKDHMEEGCPEGTDGVYVQEVLDKMMMETMQKAEYKEEDVDSDASAIDKNVKISISDPQEKKDDQFADKNEDVVNKPNIDEKKSVEDSSSSTSSSNSSDSSSSSDSDSDDDSSSSSSSSSSDDSHNENLSNSEIMHLVDRCIKGLEQCAIRLPKNYKALYRLVHLYFYYKPKKDLNKCKQLLLGEYKCYENSSISGLFADRKPTNFFNGIWRIPSNEIDRPGSLAAHMSRCLTILLQLLRDTGDCKILLDLYFQLKKNPDPDKVYIKDSERLQFSEQALSMCVQSLRNNMKNISTMNNTSIRKLLHDIYKVYIRIQKHASEKEPCFGQMLEEVYRSFIKEKIPESANALELAIKFCQQTKAIEKQRSIAAQNMTPQNPLVPAGPVLPNPASVAGSATSSKRPQPSSSTGRPRGRPPAPKQPGQTMKYQRSKTNTSSSALSNPNLLNWPKNPEQAFAYHLKQYQEELMKQYSQNLSYMQMAQLAQMYANPKSYAASFLQPTSQPSQLMSGLAGTQQMEQLAKFNEMMNVLTKSSALGNFGIEQLMASTSSGASSSLPQKKVTKTTKTGTPSYTQVTNPVDLIKTTAHQEPQRNVVAPEPQRSNVQQKDLRQSPASITVVPVDKLYRKPDPPSSISDVPKPATSKRPLVDVSMFGPAASPISVITEEPTLAKVPKLNIEAKITRVSPTIKLKQQRSEEKVAYSIDRTFPKFPSNLSMTPVVGALPTSSSSKNRPDPPRQSITLHRLPVTSSLSTPSTSSITKPDVTTKQKNLVAYKSNQDFHKLPSSLEAAHRNKPKRPEVSSVPAPFSIESMLQPTASRPRSAHSYEGTQVARTSVITSAKSTMSEIPKMTVDANFPKYGNIRAGKNVTKLYSNETASIPAVTKVKTATRIPPVDIYQDLQSKISSLYSPTVSEAGAHRLRNEPPTTYVPVQTASTSPGKTLQEKLADKKREQANKQLYRQIETQMAPQKPIVKIAPFSKEIEISRVTSAQSRPLQNLPSRRRSSSDDSVILLD